MKTGAYVDIDLDTEARKRQGIFQSCRNDFGKENFLNIMTVKTEGSKSACLTACRGMGINSDDAQFIADMIPFERGSNWSLSDCFYGNEKKERKPLTQFINEIEALENEEYGNLKETMLTVEGIIVGRSIHASGAYIFDNGYLAQNALMKAPNGSLTTQWNMKDSDWAGGLKVDFLTIEAEDKIRTWLDLAVEYGIVEKNGTLRETYNKYLHPDVLEYEDKDMWKLIGENKVASLFQFVTPIGLKTARDVQPTSLPQLADANSLMRLMPDDSGISPVETYIKYKKDISLWYDELKKWKLSEKEISILEKHLVKVYGVSSTQEEVMMLSMDSNISGFDVVEANKLRKAIAKKDPKLLEKVKNNFFSKGEKCNTREQMLHYVWDVQISRQLGYSFSKNHTYPYSNIGVQELNLAFKYNPIYWNCACLTIDSGASFEQEDTTNDGKDKSTNYGKIASAIGKMQQRDVNIVLPFINKAKINFIPDEENDEIIFGLKAVTGISDEVVHEVIKNRPFKSVKDFYEKMTLTKIEKVDAKGKKKQASIVPIGKLLTLIKAGCFDKLENKERHEIMKDFINLSCPPKTKITMANLNDIDSHGLIPHELSGLMRIINYYKFITNKDNIVTKRETSAKSKKWYKLYHSDARIMNATIEFFNLHFIDGLKEEEDYYYNSEGNICVLVGADSCKFDKIYKSKIAKLEEWLKSDECLDIYNQALYNNAWENMLSQPLSKWEMDSLSFYYSGHELDDIDKNQYDISNYFELPEKPIETGKFSIYKGRKYPKFELTRIAGTVLDRDKSKHVVSLLTTDGVVLLKFYAGNFSYYDKTISIQKQGDTKKTKIEDGWFKRGTKLLVTGYRDGDYFKPKKYSNSVYRHTISKIEEVDVDRLILKSERSQV